MAPDWLRKPSRSPKARGCRGRFVDDIEHGEPGHFAGVGSPFATWFVEVCRYGDDRIAGSIQFGDDVVFELSQDAGLEDFWREVLASDGLVIDLVSHIAFDPLGHLVGMYGGGSPSRLSDDGLVVVEKNDAWREQLPFRVADHHRVSLLVDPRDRGVGGTQVNSNSVFGEHIRHSDFDISPILGWLVVER